MGTSQVGSSDDGISTSVENSFDQNIAETSSDDTSDSSLDDAPESSLDDIPETSFNDISTTTKVTSIDNEEGKSAEGDDEDNKSKPIEEVLDSGSLMFTIGSSIIVS